MELERFKIKLKERGVPIRFPNDPNYDRWLEKYGKEEADKRFKETNKKISESKIK